MTYLKLWMIEFSVLQNLDVNSDFGQNRLNTGQNCKWVLVCESKVIGTGSLWPKNKKISQKFNCIFQSSEITVKYLGCTNL